MVGCFASSGYSIVTSEAGAGNSNVIESRWNPGKGAVTVLADIIALYVIDRFASCLYTVVAGDTGTANRHMVHACTTPADLGMAVIALFTTFYMIRLFFCSGELSGLAMTALAGFGGSLEYSIFVATVACNS